VLRALRKGARVAPIRRPTPWPTDIGAYSTERPVAACAASRAYVRSLRHPSPRPARSEHLLLAALVGYTSVSASSRRESARARPRVARAQRADELKSFVFASLMVRTGRRHGRGVVLRDIWRRGGASADRFSQASRAVRRDPGTIGSVYITLSGTTAPSALLRDAVADFRARVRPTRSLSPKRCATSAERFTTPGLSATREGRSASPPAGRRQLAADDPRLTVPGGTSAASPSHRPLRRGRNAPAPGALAETRTRPGVTWPTDVARLDLPTCCSTAGACPSPQPSTGRRPTRAAARPTRTTGGVALAQDGPRTDRPARRPPGGGRGTCSSRRSRPAAAVRTAAPAGRGVAPQCRARWPRTGRLRRGRCAARQAPRSTARC